MFPKSFLSSAAQRYAGRGVLLLLTCASLGSQAIAPAKATPSQKQIDNIASYVYEALPCSSEADQSQVCAEDSPLQIPGLSGPINLKVESLVDPLGQITGCAGELLPDYSGFSVALYSVDPTDPTGTNLGRLLPLPPTEVPDIPGNSFSLGLAPNDFNTNPFYLTNGDEGKYNFLLDANRGQVTPGTSFILVITPPADSTLYSQRRIKITIGARINNKVSYVATALDGKPISVQGQSTQVVNGEVTIQDAERTGLALGVLDLSAGVCQSRELQITKSGDRATAQPGDTVIYRLSVRNLASAAVTNLAITDTLPLGFRFLADSVRAEFQGAAVPVQTIPNGSAVTFVLVDTVLPQALDNQQAALNLVYAATLNPDAVRGSGENTAIAQGVRSDNRQPVKDGPAIHRVQIRPGLVSDCGTILGRVFEDKNFDGEQQPGEPGIANAVVFMDDGNRITTDENGMFSVAGVLPGYRSGVLDLTSIPGYTLAPNTKLIERNSQSRLVQLEPNGMVRMNFAVTPAADTQPTAINPITSIQPPAPPPAAQPVPTALPVSPPASTPKPALVPQTW